MPAARRQRRRSFGVRDEDDVFRSEGASGSPLLSSEGGSQAIKNPKWVACISADDTIGAGDKGLGSGYIKAPNLIGENAEGTGKTVSDAMPLTFTVTSQAMVVGGLKFICVKIDWSSADPKGAKPELWDLAWTDKSEVDEAKYNVSTGKPEPYMKLTAHQSQKGAVLGAQAKFGDNYMCMELNGDKKVGDLNYENNGSCGVITLRFDPLHIPLPVLIATRIRQREGAGQGLAAAQI